VRSVSRLRCRKNRDEAYLLQLLNQLFFGNFAVFFLLPIMARTLRDSEEGMLI
jgi:hypothetical protein